MNISHRGFLIHTRKYKETSSIVYIFSQSKGIQSLIFKGKYTNKEKFKFSLFNEYLFTFNDKYSFPYMSKFELINEYTFDKKYYLLGLYINELLYKTLKQGYDFEKIYQHYKKFIVYLSDSSDKPNRLALLFEKNLIEDLGYGLHMADEHTVTDQSFYSYDIDQGFKQSNSPNKYCIRGKLLKEYFSNTLMCEDSIKSLRMIIKRTLYRIYPDLNLYGDILF
tara:strand:+ start:1750 stop:2415 length:666 start_codon:yes stop_codon:yes gene_type:complete